MPELQMSKHVIAFAANALLGLVLLVPSAAKAEKLVDENLCILENMGNTRSEVARFHIRNACNFLSLHAASFELNSDQRRLSECVLKYLPGTESDANATELARTCQQLVWDR